MRYECDDCAAYNDDVTSPDYLKITPVNQKCTM